MLFRANMAKSIAGLVCFGLSACGGGNSGIAFAPDPIAAPRPTPTPAPTPAPPNVPVTIFANPSPQQYAGIGVSTTNAGDGYSAIEQNTRLIDVSIEPTRQPSIRYNAAGYYEVRLPGAAYDRLIHYKGLLDPTRDNNFFQTASASQNHATFITRRSADLGFQYSELASWSDANSGLTGYLAFGSPTPTSSIPVTGSATYRGVTSGQVDITYFDNLYGGYYFGGIDGYSTLNVDFARSLLTGSLELYVPDGMQSRLVGNFTTSPMTLTSGTNSFSGQFITGLTGFNHFNGLFTGPAAQEAIGSWALPLMINGQSHQAIGAWIARRQDGAQAGR
ncbi:hypothetical protein [Erythrobacter alti]|uniref:hypothetical protein n=1 Tax=Erythrobacter alti TaxID=1896145 RepID=UPI0030F4AFE0